MSDVIRLKKGLDIPLEGAPAQHTVQLPLADSYAVKPRDFMGFTPKLLVREGDKVEAGSPLMFDKYRPQQFVTSPVSGLVSVVRRGEKRAILEVVVTPDSEIKYKDFGVAAGKKLTKEEITALMLESGLWNFIIQRPYGIIANPEDTPRDIFISGFDSAPLAPDMNYVLKGEKENIEAAVKILSHLTTGRVHIGLDATREAGFLEKTGAQTHLFKGPHPAGNVGVQIHHTAPINKGETVWTINIQNLAILGRFFRTGTVDMAKTIALAGSRVESPRYYRIISGASVRSIVKGRLKPGYSNLRFISGNVLTGTKVERSGYLGFYANMLTVIPEGDSHEFIGWLMPRFNKFSVWRSYFSWLMPKKKRYDLDTNLNGGKRALVMTGAYDKYLPMDIYPLYLLKAAIAGDIDKMENLGIYEVIEEDLALVEFIDPSKTEVQDIIRGGLDLMLKEM